MIEFDVSNNQLEGSVEGLEFAAGPLNLVKVTGNSLLTGEVPERWCDGSISSVFFDCTELLCGCACACSAANETAVSEP